MTYPINWWYFSHPPLKEYGSFDVCAIVLAPLFTAESTHTIYFRKCLHSLHGKNISQTLAKFTIIIQLQKNPNGQNQKNWSSLSKTYGEVRLNYQCFILTSISSTTSHHLGLSLYRYLVQYILHNSNSPSNTLASIIHIVFRSRPLSEKLRSKGQNFIRYLAVLLFTD